MRIWMSTLLPLGLVFFMTSPALAWHARGHVFCDANGDQRVNDPGDTPLENVRVLVENIDPGGFSDSNLTDATGHYSIRLLDEPESYRLGLDPTTLPSDAVVIVPSAGELLFETKDNDQSIDFDFLVDSEICRERVGQCWMTGGGVKFSTMTDIRMAEHGPRDSLGGNVFPSCSPEPGMGGQWNHIAHGLKLHFKGNSIHTVECGNVEGIEPGSESPVTPFNFIEFYGEGTLSGIKGNKFPTIPVTFFGRVEDRNEPGSNGARDGEDVDRYFMHAVDASGTTVLLVDMDNDPETVDPITITGGNLQLHISSCDDPPSF